MSQLHSDVTNMIYFLSLPEAVERKGSLWCQTHVINLTLTLHGSTPTWSDESLIEQLETIKRGFSQDA